MDPRRKSRLKAEIPLYAASAAFYAGAVRVTISVFRRFARYLTE